MEIKCIPKFARLIAILHITLGVVILLITVASLHRFYSAGFFILQHSDADKCNESRTRTTINEGYTHIDLKALTAGVEDVLFQLSRLQDKLESTIRKPHDEGNKINTEFFRLFLEQEVIQPLYTAHIALRRIRLPKSSSVRAPGSLMEDPLINFFVAEETRRYLTAKSNRNGKVSVYGTNKTYNTIGHACVLMKRELEEYMSFEIGSYCRDDWNLAQKLMLGGCDPLPRRRCLARAPKLYRRPLPINESLWTVPDDRNVRWSHYQCPDFSCLANKTKRRGFSKCTGCFDFEREKRKWVTNSSLAEFLISDVVAVKRGEIRIGLDVSVGTGSFAARMREWNVTIVSTSMNVGAPFSEVIALRGLIPLYVTLGQRLPLFDNTMDLIHTSVFLDGWIDLQLLDLVLFEWDRVLRPGGLLWVDKFFCNRGDLDDYMYMFLQFRYSKLKWLVSFKSKQEVYLSALLEKPLRSV